ncbi:diacylglycerol kinase family protein [Streptomyces sp. NPDC005438]|uniref:diacylglycerol kinase family protein n=1 Tax=Streptomyces sp. NPDC005438 TaxID=3156880 RepID=UPI0033B48ADF
MSDEITLLVNPTAGGGRGARAAEPVTRILQDAGHRVRALQGRDVPEALELAHRSVAEGTGALVAVGGDGMISLALQAVAGTSTPLGVVAVGTGNDIARSLGLPVRDPEGSARLLARAADAGEGRRIDLGRTVPGDGVPGQWFASVLAAGFDSRVNDRGNRMRLPLGRFKYDLAILAELAAFRPIPYRLTLDDGPTEELEATLIAVGNGPSYGGGMRICADASYDDGLFDLTVVGECGRGTLLRVFPRVYSGTHLSHPVVTVRRARRVRVEAALPEGQTLSGYADGDRLGVLPLTVECVAGAVTVLGAGEPRPGE